MKQKLLTLTLLLCLIAIAFESYSQCYTISGAGQAPVNGSYTKVNGQNYYVHSSGNYYLTKDNGGGYWAISTGASCFSCGYYRATNATTDPSGITGWKIAGLGGASPVPNLPSACSQDTATLNANLSSICYGKSTE